MAEVKTEVKTKRENPRDAIREQRMKRLRVIDGPPKTVKVYAGSEKLGQILRHPSGKGFRSPGEAAEWPNDSFTHRRIKEGSLRTESNGNGGEPSEPDPTKNAREQAEAMKPKPKEEKSESKSESKSRSQQSSSQTPAA